MKIAFLGLGLMGKLMAERLLEKKYDVTVWNRTLSKARSLKTKGAKVAVKSADAIRECDVIITMLSDFNAVSSSLFSEKNNFSGKTVIQMSTIAPGESCIIMERVEQAGGEYIEAPVLGGIAQIPSGKLIPMVGGKKKLFDKWKTFLGIFGEEIHYMGEVGKGSAAKLACNQLIATMVSSFAMSLGYIQSQGIDVETFMKIIRPSGYYAPAYDKKLESMVNRDYTNTNFALKNLLKDVNLAISEFSSSGLEISPLEAVGKILNEAMRQRLSDLDYAALYEVIHPRE
jgi:3-hydroxyisobutyrate dehydrogenase